MKYIVCCLAVCVLLLCAACKDQAPQANTTEPTTKVTAAIPSEGWITADSMRVRGGAGLTFEVVGGITYGEKVEILGKEGDWYKIRFGDGVGYVSGHYLSFTEPTPNS